MVLYQRRRQESMLCSSSPLTLIWLGHARERVRVKGSVEAGQGGCTRAPPAAMRQHKCTTGYRCEGAADPWIGGAQEESSAAVTVSDHGSAVQFDSNIPLLLVERSKREKFQFGCQQLCGHVHGSGQKLSSRFPLKVRFTHLQQANSMFTVSISRRERPTR